MTRVAVLCARGGSKAVPGKNIKTLAGQPLIYWTIEQARSSNLFDYIVVSSDAPNILLTAKNAGATYLVERPEALATDAISVLPAIEHALATLEADINLKIDSFVLLQPTSPTREVEDIIGAIYVVYRARFFIDQQMIWPDTQLFEMVDENLVDIDTPLDLEIANMIIKERQKLKP